MVSYVISSPPPGEERDLLIERMWALGTLGIVEGESTLEVYFDDGFDAAVLADLKPHRIEHEDIDWIEETKRSFPAMNVGERFFVVPPWSEEATPAGRFRLVINPGQACGTGQHPCTRLCLQALERHVKPGMRVLDVGAGSGILSLAAGMLGASVVVSCDIDHETMTHCEGPLRYTGSADAMAGGEFDLVVSNIGAEVNCALLVEFRRVLRQGGIVILSGYEQALNLPGSLQTLEQEGWFAEVVQLF